jgi:hypothetical protein
LGNRVVGLSFGGGQDDLAAQGNLRDFELILLDDCSTDDSRSTL